MKPGDQMPEASEGLLGRVPEQTESIANLMLFDSDVNVYGDSSVYIPEFDYKARKMINAPKGKKFQANYVARQKEERMRQKYIKDQKKNAKGLQEAPQTILKRQEWGDNAY